MELYCKTPKGLNLSGNISENWRKFKQSFEIFLKASGSATKPDEVKVAILLNIVGEEGVELYNTFNLQDVDKNNFTKVLQCFEEYCVPKKNIVYETFKFFNRLQQEGEKFESFLTDIKKLSQTCEFGTLLDRMVRDRIVLGIKDKVLQERLLRIEDLDLQKAIDCCRAAEVSKAQARNLQGDKAEIDSLQKKKKHQKFNKVKGKETSKFDCRRCGTKHGPRECPAYGKKCNKCSKLNHFAVSCKVKKVKEITEHANVDAESKDSSFCIDNIEIGNINTRWYETVKIGENNIKFKLDSGSDVNVIPLNIYDKIKKSGTKLKQADVILEIFGGDKMKPIGTVDLICSIKDIVKKQRFVVVKAEVMPLLSLQACREFNLIKRVHMIKGYNSKDMFISENIDVFEGNGSFKKTCTIEVDKKCTPIACPPRRIPYLVRDKLKNTLLKMMQNKIITKVENPQGWISNLVVVEKTNGKIRICLDPRDLNKVIKRPRDVLIPTVDELTEKLANKCYFTVLDLKDGFWHVKLDEKSSELCTFSTPFGCYKFNRLPFGLNMAPEYFQKINTENFGDIEGVVVYFDDILIAADTEKDHDTITKKVIDRARKIGVKFNKNKVQYKVSSVKYLGHIFSSEGMTIDPERVQAILSIESPTNVKKLQSIIGMINFLRNFIPNLSEKIAPLRELLKKDVKFQWLPVHENCLNKIKEEIANAPVLANFDINKEITIQADASQYGLGCCLMQNGKPVSFASRSLTKSEENLAQIEKELLSIVFATQKFHSYIYGQKINVITDHKPLIRILNKKISEIPSTRLQRMRIKLLKYQIEISYKPGKEMHIADLLSRSFLNETTVDDKWLLEVVHTIDTGLKITNDKNEEFKKATSTDPTLSKLKFYHVNGWPKIKKNIDDRVKHYFNLQDQISIKDDLIYLNFKLIIPLELRKYVLQLLHESHFGITKTKARANQVIYWPGITKDIEEMISKCAICEKYSNSNIKEPLINHEIPNVPFAKVASDIFQFEGENYLVMQDYYSKWLEIKKIKNKTGTEIIDKFKTIFATHGIPNILICDNQPYNSQECREFANKWNFKITTSSPNYPRSNGLAERAVQTAKKILKKCEQQNVDMELALLEYRNMPIQGLNISPAQIMFNRRVKTKIPIHPKLLQPEIPQNVHKKLLEKQNLTKKYHDLHTKERKQFKEGETVLEKVGKTWKPAKILYKHNTPRSYVIINNNKNIVRRNSSHLKTTKTQFQVEDYEDDYYNGSESPHTNQNTKDCESSVPPNDRNKDQTAKMTRSGRTIKTPTKFKDYIL